MMELSDDAFKQLKERHAKTIHTMEMPTRCGICRLFARLGAAEKIVDIVKRYVERQDCAAACRCDFCYALKLWRQAAGK